MSDKDKNKYRVTSPIKHGGKRYEENEPILLTEEESEGLHVIPFEEGKAPAEEKEDTAKASPSSGLGAKQAIKIIETSDLGDLKGFVIPEPEGDEDRTTVLEAWEKKQAPAEETEAKADDKDTKSAKKKS